jgi:uncharacterized protein
VSTKEKLVLYVSTIAFQWILMSLVAWRSFARGLTRDELGLARPLSIHLFVFSLIGAALLATFQWMNLRRIGRMTGPVPDFMRQIAAHILPGNAIELSPYLALAVTAGICEEFLYRGFVVAALSRDGIATWVIVIVSSVLFGLAHTYQGGSGVAGTTMMGIAFALARLGLLSLLPVMIWHSAVDVVAGIAGPRYLTSPKPS